RAAKLFEPAHELLRDHVVQGDPMLPGVVYLEMARAAVAAAEATRPLAELRNIVWKSPFRVKDKSAELAVTLRPRNDHIAFDFTCAQGEAVFGDPPTPPVL